MSTFVTFLAYSLTYQGETQTRVLNLHCVFSLMCLQYFQSKNLQILTLGLGDRIFFVLFIGFLPSTIFVMVNGSTNNCVFKLSPNREWLNFSIEEFTSVSNELAPAAEKPDPLFAYSGEAHP